MYFLDSPAPTPSPLPVKVLEASLFGVGTVLRLEWSNYYEASST